ncbi:unnamed protein product [Paramecium sonneborni]|uniref:Transmembrane protein n=1 Tax=Paramecium sonneborni TaxID=65129 RepID=A0A8S1Q8F4_9CILI|nr:unnamed protein product [Paramecium sonneborni]
MQQAQKMIENQALDQENQDLSHQINKIYTINKKEYHYVGPQNEEIRILLNILDIYQENGKKNEKNDQSGNLKICISRSRNVLEKILFQYEKDFENFCRPFKLQIEFHTYDLIIIFFYIIIWIIALLQSLNLSNNDTIKSNEFRSDISQNLPQYLSLLTFFSLLFQNIQMVSLWIILFILLILIPLLIQLTYDQSTNYQLIGFCIVSYLIFIISLINKGITTYLTRIYNELIAAIYKCGFCLFVMYLFLFQIIITILNEFDQIDTLIEEIINLTAPSVFIIIFAFSIVIYQELCKLSPIQIEMDLKLLANIKQSDQLIRNSILQIVDELFDNTRRKLNLQKTVPILIFVSYSILEIYCFVSTLYELNKGDQELALTFFSFFLMIPLFLFLISHMTNSGYHPQNLYLYGTLFYVVFLGFICLMCLSYLKDIDHFKQVSKIIGMFPLFINLAWSMIGYFKSEKKDYQMFTYGIVLIGFAFPLGFLNVLSDVDQLNYSALQIFFWIFISLGLIPVIIIMIYHISIIVLYLYDSIKLFKLQDFSTAFKCIDLNNYAQLFNQLIFTIGFYAVCYYVWNEPQSNQSNIKKGVLQGLLVILIALFVLINKALILDKINVLTSQESEEYFNSCLNYIIYLIIFMFFIVLPIALTISNKTLSYALLINAICLPFVGIYYYNLIMFKKYLLYEKYQKFIIPLIIIQAWIFFIGPFGVIAPILAINFESQTKEFSIFVQIFTTYLILIIIFFINIRAILKSLILNKEEQEMKKKKILKEIIQNLFQYGVYSDEETCSLIYFKYLNMQKQNLLENLIEGDPVNISVYNKDEQENDRQFFQKKLISKLDYESIQMANQNQVITSLSYWDRFLYFVKQILFCQCGKYQLEQDKLKQRYYMNLLRIKAVQKSLEISQSELIKVETDQFFKAIVNSLQNKVEEFWLKFHKYFEKDLSIVLDILNLKRNDFILSKFQSFSLNQNNGFTLSVEDFAILIFNSLCLQAQSKEFYPTLQKYAKNLYPKLKVHKPDFIQTTIQTKLNHPFNQKIKQIPYRLELIKDNEIEEIKVQQDNAIESIDQISSKLKFWKFCYSIHKCIWITPKKFLEQLKNKLLISSLQPQILNETIQFKDTPQWKQLAQEIIDIIEIQSNKFDQALKNQEQQEIKFYISIPNILQFLIKLFEMIALSFLAFDEKVGWFGESQYDFNLQIVEQSNSTDYIALLIIALILSFLYILLGFSVSQQIENNTYGLDENHQIVSFPQIKYFINKALQIISGQFIFIMKIYIDAFICDYSEYPYMLIRKKDLQCYEDLHFIVILLSIFGCIIYYPLQAYLLPIFQYNDYSLDLKYKSNYVVIFTQAKLLILGLSTVFRNVQEQAYQYQMAFVSFLLILLFIFQYKTQPCFVKWFNKIDQCLLSIVFSIYFGGFIMMYFKIFYVGWIIILAISFPAVGYMFVVIVQNFNNILRKNNNNFNQIHNQENQN